MTNENTADRRDYRVILAWLVLALQIIGLLWLLLFGRDQWATLTGADASRAESVELAEATAAPEPTSDETGDAATAEPAATEAVDAAATAEAESTATAEAESAATAEAESAATAEAESAAALETALEAALSPEEVTVDASAVAPDWLATLVEGGAAGGQPGIPPHLLLTFVDPENPEAAGAAPDAIDLNQPQLRIIPIASLLAALEQRGNDAGQEALEALLLLLEQQPDADEAAVPVPPVLGDVVQNFVARAAYRPFGGGSGIGYVTAITGENVIPVTNESGLNYVYQGVTADGEQYVFMSWPMDADFLPETAAEASEAAEQVESNRAGYFDALRQQVTTADDATMRPALALLGGVLRSLSIGGQTAAIPQGEAVPGAAADAVGFTWYWTGGADAEGAPFEVENPPDYTLVLWPDGTYTIRADCNVGSGVHSDDGDGAIRFTPGPLTRALCPPDSRDAEFIASLGAVQTIGFNESGDMVLGLEDGGTMTFANVGPAEGEDVAAAEEQVGAADAGLTGLTLQWPGYTNAAGESITVDNPEDYAITLLPDGTFTLVADCNVGGGAFTYSEDGSLQLGPIRLTRALCPDGSRGDTFISFLEGVTAATVNEDGTITMTGADGSSASFVPGAESGGLETAEGDEDDLVGTVWQWTGRTATGDDAALTVEDPAAYLLTLWPDGASTFTADCNVGRGSYTRDGDVLTLGPAATTLALCPEGSLGDEYTGLLARVNRYAVTDGGALELTLDDGTVMTFADGGPAEIDTEAVAPGQETAAQPTPADLQSISWRWIELTPAGGAATPVGNPERYTLALLEDGSYAFRADCNNGAGSYTLDGAALTLGPAATTLAACAADSLSDAFVGYLGRVMTAGLDPAGNLLLTLDDGTVLTFANGGPFAADDLGAVADDPLAGTAWQWTHFRDAKQDYDVTGDYTIAFNPDGSVAVVADCNNGRGTYTLSGDGVTISVQATTRAACPPGSLSQTFIDYLNQAGTFAFGDQSLSIILMADGGVMTFARLP